MSIKPVDEMTIRKRVESYFAERNELFTHAAIFVVVNIALAFVGLVAIPQFPWTLIVLFGWGAGLIGHAVEVLAKAPRRLAEADRTAFQQMTQIYGPDWMETATEDNYRRIYRAAHTALNQKKEFLIHLGVYVPVNITAWILWLNLGGDSVIFPLALMLLWGIGLVGHGISIYGSTARATQTREQAIQQAIEREHEWLNASIAGGKAKRKREPDKQRLMQRDDGTVLEIDEADWEHDDQAPQSDTRS